MKRQGHISQAILAFSVIPFFRDTPYILFNNSWYKNPVYLAVIIFSYIFLALLPDIDFKFKRYKGQPIWSYHRQWTHSLLLWLIVYAYAYFTRNEYLFLALIPILTHLAGDMLTGSIPILLYGRYSRFFERVGIDRIYKSPKINEAIANFFEAIAPVIYLAAFILLFYWYDKL